MTNTFTTIFFETRNWRYRLFAAAFLCVAITGFAIARTATNQAQRSPLNENPDPDHIQGSSGDPTIKLVPRNDIEDHRNLQWAFDNAAPGGTIQLGVGTFYLGDGKDAPRKTAWMRRGLKLAGVREGSEWRTVIRGGGEVLDPGVGGPLESGPIRVKLEEDDHAVVIEDIWFRDWACEVVFILACNGFEFRRNRISDPANTANPDGIRFVHALWTTGNDARGDFIVEDNLVEMGNYDGPIADDEQFLGVLGSNHDNIRIVNNTIFGIDEAIEILANRFGESGPGDPIAASSPSEIVVAGNRIDVSGTHGPRWSGSFAILIAGNLNVDRVRIENNDVTKRGVGWGMCLTGSNMRVAGNTFRFEALEGRLTPGAVTVGGMPLFWGKDLGASLTNSVFENNTFEGRVRDHGVYFAPGRGDRPNASRGNRMDFGESLSALGAETTLTISEHATDNEFSGDIDTVADNSRDEANNVVP